MYGKTHRIDYEKYIKELAYFMNENGCHLKPFPKYKISNKKQEGLLIRTGYYDPATKTITLFIYGRALKDIMRTCAHENIHHSQNLDGKLVGYKGDTLGQDEKLDELEKEAYEKGNILFRKWTEQQSKSEKPSKSFGKHMKKKINIDESELESVKEFMHRLDEIK